MNTENLRKTALASFMKLGRHIERENLQFEAEYITWAKENPEYAEVMNSITSAVYGK